LKIPKKFKLHGIIIEVTFDEKTREKNDNIGTALYREEKIILHANVNKVFNEKLMEKTFIHELIHHILNEMGEHDLCSNEKFVDVFAGLLHQAIDTMEY
jgi:hypothetical protein